MCVCLCVCACQTVYSVRAEIRPAAGEQQCRTGTLCRLEVSLTRLSEPDDTDRCDEEFMEAEGLRTTRLMYEGTTESVCYCTTEN